MAITEDDENDFHIYTMKEICAFTTYSRTHIYRLERDGKFIRRVRIGPGRIGFRRRDFKKWMNERPLADLPPEDPDTLPDGKKKLN